MLNQSFSLNLLCHHLRLFTNVNLLPNTLKPLIYDSPVQQHLLIVNFFQASTACNKLRYSTSNENRLHVLHRDTVELKRLSRA